MRCTALLCAGCKESHKMCVHGRSIWLCCAGMASINCVQICTHKEKQFAVTGVFCHHAFDGK